MANLVTTERLDSLLSYLTDAWEGLPTAITEIDQWDVEDRIDYAEEWTPKLQLLRELRELVKSSPLTSTQQRRVTYLESLVEQHAETLAQLRTS